MGSAQVPFLGFDQLTSSTSFSNLDDDLLSSVRPELALILRKLSKKDAVTKIKALDELQEQLRLQSDFSESSDIHAILPFWVRRQTSIHFFN